MIDTTKILEKMLNESPLRILDIQNLKLEEDSPALAELNMLCERKAAYRFGLDGYIGYQFLWNLILGRIKQEEDVDNLIIDGRSISPNIVCKILNSMENEGLITKENNIYRVVLHKILSKEAISKFCWGRADKITIEDILEHFHFMPTRKVYGSTTSSPAFDYVKEIINQLCVENLLKKYTIQGHKEFYSWSDI